MLNLKRKKIIFIPVLRGHILGKCDNSLLIKPIYTI